MIAETWLKCTVAAGQFSGEFVVKCSTFDKQDFSLFADSEDLECLVPPSENNYVEGRLRVRIIVRDKSLALVRLPQQALENGRTVTVRMDQIETRKPRQEA